MRRLAPNSLIAAAVFFLSMLIPEGLLRAADYPGSPYTRPDLETAARFVAGAYYKSRKAVCSEGWISSKVFRDHGYSCEKPPGTYRILVIGDSYTEAIQLPLENCFVKLLDRRLNKKPPDPSFRSEVWNMGMSGYGATNESFLCASEGVKYHGDLVILAFQVESDFRNNSRELDGYPYRPYFVLDQNGELREDLRFRAALKKRLSGWRGALIRVKDATYLLSLVSLRWKLLFTPQKRNVLIDDRRSGSLCGTTGMPS